MQQFFTTIPGIVISLGAILTVAVTGLLFLIGIFSKQKSEKKKEEDGDEDRLINIVKTTVDELEKKVDQQGKEITNLRTEVQKLRDDNKKYIEIFQGRDQETKDFYTRAYASMGMVAQTHDIVTTMAESIKNTNQTMQNLIQLYGKSVEVVSKVVDK